MLPVAPRSPAPLDTILCGSGFLALHLSISGYFLGEETAASPLSVYPLLREGSRLRMGLVPR